MRKQFLYSTVATQRNHIAWRVKTQGMEMDTRTGSSAGNATPVS
jgi:hypothetical protein